MSVLKRKRNISKMEFYHNAIKLRLMITEFLLKDFGIKSRRRNLEFAKDVYDIEDEDVEEIENILSAYDLKNSFIDNFPSWLIDKERDYFMDLLRSLMKNICSANTIHITNKEEYYMRRNYQTQAICDCENLLQEMQYIIYVTHPNVEKYMPYVDIIEKEIALLKGWRKSDNKIMKILEEQLLKRVRFDKYTWMASGFCNVNNNGNSNYNNASNSGGVRP